MTTRTTVRIKARDLIQGDIVDVRSFALAYGFRYWKVLENPHGSGGRWPENVALRLRAIHATIENWEQCRLELYGHYFHVHGDTPVSVRRDSRVAPKQCKIWF